MFTSSVGKKLVMAFTGIFLILFLIVHVALNACIWAMDGGEMFNKGAHFMGANVEPFHQVLFVVRLKLAYSHDSFYTLFRV